MKSILSHIPQHWIVPAILLLSISIPGSGMLYAANDGGYPGAFLRLDISARAAAMGGAHTAIADGPSGYHYNPAGPAWAEEPMGEAAYRKMGFDRLHGFVAVVIPLHKEAAIVGSWVHAGVSDVYERDLQGEIGEEIGESNNAVSFTFAKKFTPYLAIGANLRYVQMNIAGINANTVGFDLGLSLNLPDEMLSIGGPKGLTDIRMGVVLERINYKYPWNTSEYWVKYGETGQSFEERWPINLRAGVAASVFEKRATIALDIEANEETSSLFHAGLEITPIPELALRGGINGENLTAGAGFLAPIGNRKLVVNYAFLMTDDNIDDEHLISIGVQF